MSKKHKKISKVLNYFERFALFIATVTGCVSFSVFASLVVFLVVITSSAVELKIGAKTVGIKKYKSIIKKKKKKHAKVS